MCKSAEEMQGAQRAMDIPRKRPPEGEAHITFTPYVKGSGCDICYGTGACMACHDNGGECSSCHGTRLCIACEGKKGEEKESKGVS